MAAIVKMLKQKMPQPVKLNFIQLRHFNLYKIYFNIALGTSFSSKYL